MTTKTKLVTYDDYRELPDDGKRYEIIGGELFMTAAPYTTHQRILRDLLLKLSSFVDNHGLGEVLFAPVDVVLSMTDVVQPDLVFVAADRQEIITQKNIVAAPDLVVEVISESTAKIDRTRKKALYEKYGVKEYWIVDPGEQTIEQYVLHDDIFKLKNSKPQSKHLSSKVIKNLSLDVKEVIQVR